MLLELEQNEAIFDLPRRKFFTGAPGLNTSVDYAGHRVASPLGPAAGPHTQMAQNLVLSWLAGARIMELKTVQVLDDLTIPRPCIDMRTVGFNAERSQELTVAESLAEYVKDDVHHALRDGGRALRARLRSVVYDMSLGYDLAGIRARRCRARAGMRTPARRGSPEIPAEYACRASSTSPPTSD